MKKPIILFLFGIALWLTLRNYYKNNQGLPKPQVIAGPVYLYSIIGLTADFTGDVAIPIAAALTLALYFASVGVKADSSSKGVVNNAGKTVQSKSGWYSLVTGNPVPAPKAG